MTADPQVASRRQITRVVARVLLTTAALTTLYYVLPLNRASTVAATLAWLVTGLTAFLATVIFQVRGILNASQPVLRAIAGFGAALPLFVLVFASTYLLLDATVPGAFTEPLSHTDALYFTVTVFTTVGFGDIAPQSQEARLATTIQMIGGLLVLGLLARVVVSAVQDTRQRQQRQPSVHQRQ